MKYIRAIFRDKFLLLAAFFILLPTGFKLCCGVEGRIFVAQPLATDPNFDHTVLYMVRHSIDGASAIVLNRQYPSIKKNKIPPFISQRNIPVFWGGPIGDETDLFVLELQGDQKPKIMSFDNWVAEDIDILDKIEKSPKRYRIYMGHAEWQPLQYEMERIYNVWVLGAKRSIIFPEIFSNSGLGGHDIWLKALENSDFYKKQAIKGKTSA
jgi:putative transcriptional regulator